MIMVHTTRSRRSLAKALNGASRTQPRVQPSSTLRGHLRPDWSTYGARNRGRTVPWKPQRAPPYILFKNNCISSLVTARGIESSCIRARAEASAVGSAFSRFVIPDWWVLDIRRFYRRDSRRRELSERFEVASPSTSKRLLLRHPRVTGDRTFQINERLNSSFFITFCPSSHDSLFAFL